MFWLRSYYRYYRLRKYHRAQTEYPARLLRDFCRRADAGDRRAVTRSFSALEVAEEPDEAGNIPDENGVYSSRDDVALYIHVYGRLPANFITKEERTLADSTVEKYVQECIAAAISGN